jgi:hypothetical protein
VLRNYTPGTSVSLLSFGYEIDADGVSPSQKSEPGYPGSHPRIPLGER